MRGIGYFSVRRQVTAFLTLLLVACGGGGGGNTVVQVPPPLSPPLAVSPELNPTAIKTLSFTWQDVSGATHYRLLENPDSNSGFTQVGGDIARGVGVIDHVVPLFARLNAQYILQSCNTAGCTDSPAMGITKSLTSAIGYVKASNTEANDRFGIAVSLSADGSTLAISAVNEDGSSTGANGNQSDNSAGNSGAVYVFRRTGDVWSQQAYLKASNTDADDQFGNAVSLSADGNTLVVGAFFEDSNAGSVNGNQSDNSASTSGAAYVFSRTADVWSQQAYVKASNADSLDRFGGAVALSADGNTIAIGAREESSGATGVNGNQADNSLVGAGAVYVFVRTGNEWSQQAYVKASNTEVFDLFGTAISLSADGNTLVVGADGEASSATGIDGNQNDNAAVNAGAVYVFGRSGDEWSHEAYVKASNAGAGDLFGFAVSLSADGNILAVSAPREGSSVIGINGNQSDNAAADSGAVYVFSRSAGAWSQQAYVKASNTNAGDQFGFSVSLTADGNRLAVGAWAEDGGESGIEGNQSDNSALDSGAVYVYEFGGSSWFQLAYTKAGNPDPDDVFGAALSLSADGNTLAVVARLEDSIAGGINGNQEDNTVANSGAVYLY